MADTDRKPEKIDLAQILGDEPDPSDPPGRGGASDQGDVVLLDPSTGEPMDGTGQGGRLAPAATAEALRAAVAEKEKYHDLWVRARADFENLRKRVEREREEETARAGAALVRDLLPVADNLERALAGALAQDPFSEGVALIHRQLMECLMRAGLEPIDAIGALFDPLYHEAVLSERTDRFEPNRVLEEVQKGYKFRGRVLRPSLVKVSAAPMGATGEEATDRDEAAGPS